MKEQLQGVARHLPRAILLASLFALLWAVIEGLGCGIHVSAYEVVWTRYVTHLAFLLLVLGPRHGGRMVRTGHPCLQVVASLLMLGMPLCFIAAVRRMDVADVMSVFWVAPLMVAAVSVCTREERLRWPHWAGIAGASLGAVLLTGPHVGRLRLAVVFPLGMALCFSAYQVAVRAMSTERMAAKLFHTALWVFLAVSLVVPHFWQTPSSGDLVAMAAIGVLGCVALFALDRALELAPPAVIAPAICTQPIWARILQHGRFSLGSEIGVALVLAGVAACLTWQAEPRAGHRRTEFPAGMQA